MMITRAQTIYVTPPTERAISPLFPAMTVIYAQLTFATPLVDALPPTSVATMVILARMILVSRAPVIVPTRP